MVCSMERQASRELSPRTAAGCGTQHPHRVRLRLAGRGPNGSSLLLPLAAVVAAAELQSRPIKQSLPGPHPQVIRWRNSLPSCQKSYCASNRCRYSFGVQCFSSRKVLMK